MKRIIMVAMLLWSVTGQLYAQETKTDKAFYVPNDYLFHRRFFVNLDKGNTLKIELSDMSDLQRVMNIDSILEIFAGDLQLLRDSLQDPQTAKRIDYHIDAAGVRKIRFRQTPPLSSSFLVQQGELASLRIEQDTISIVGIIANPAPAHEKVSKVYPRYYRFVLQLNSIDELKTLMDGRMTIKLKTLQDNWGSSKWVGGTRGWGNYKLTADRSITASLPKGDVGIPKDFVGFSFQVGVANYKKYFVPSFSLGAALYLSDADRRFRREIGLMWEPNYSFLPDSAGKMRTYMDNFVTLILSQGPVKDNDPRKDNYFITTLSISYLAKRSGPMFEKNTWRFGMGKLKLAKTTIEPLFYTKGFFKNVTPGIRIAQSF